MPLFFSTIWSAFVLCVFLFFLYFFCFGVELILYIFLFFIFLRYFFPFSFFVSAAIFDCPVFKLQVRNQPRLGGIFLLWAFRILDYFLKIFLRNFSFYSGSFPVRECYRYVVICRQYLY